jgi:RHS repeat-associated protein
VLVPLGKTSRYEYAADGLLGGLEDNRAKAYSFLLNRDRQRKFLQFPDASKIESTYDANGNLAVWTAKSGAASIHLDYDSADRLTSQWWRSGDYFGKSIYDYDAEGRLSALTSTLSGVKLEQSFSYDSEGRLSIVTLNQRMARLAYDANSRLSTLTYPAGFSVSYTYNKDGQVKTISKGGTLLASYTYDSAGRLASRTIGNTAITSYSYTATGRIASIEVSIYDFELKQFVTLWSANYAYNELDQRASVSSRGKKNLYDYNARGELTRVRYDFGYASLFARTETLTYDAAGNRLSQIGSGTTASYRVNDLNQYTSIIAQIEGAPSASGSNYAPPYNARGDISGLNGWSYGYDAAGHLLSASNGTGKKIHWFYDGLGDRVARKSGSTLETSLSLSSHPLEIYNTTTGTATSTIYEPGIDRPLATINNAGTVVNYIHQDALGSVVGLTNPKGVLYEEYRYDAWGVVNMVAGGGTPSSRFLFTGREYDAETGLYHYRARAYSPYLGRFLQLDPIDFAGGDLNVYRYVGNNVSNWIDPLGLFGLPDDPSGLPPGWTPDPSHRDPNGQRFRDGKGNKLDFHKGRKGATGWKGKNHWHYNDCPDHLGEGEEVPDAQPEEKKDEDKEPKKQDSAEKKLRDAFNDAMNGARPYIPQIPEPPLFPWSGNK